VARPYLIKVKGVEDLVNVAMTTQIFVVHRISVDSGKSIYYVSLPSYDSLAIYYCEVKDGSSGKYFLFNRFTGEVQISDRYVDDSKYIVIPIVEVVEQEIIPKEIIEKSSSKKKGKKKRKCESKEGGSSS